MINNIQGTGNSVGVVNDAAPGKSISKAFENFLDETANNLQKADETALQANTGGPVDLHEVMIAMEKADISMRLLVQVRNKAIDAYQEVMRMQV